MLLAPPDVLAAALRETPALRQHIRHLHVMGGWVEVPSEDAQATLRWTTYNWNMAPEASRDLLASTDIPMTVYSSHVIKSSFSGGSIHPANFPAVTQLLETAQQELPSLAESAIASKSWDRHLIELIPALQETIGKHVGKQFTPADPAVIVGLSAPDFLRQTRPVRIRIDVSKCDPKRGFAVAVEPDPTSPIRLVEELDPRVFERELLAGLRELVSRKGWPKLPVKDAAVEIPAQEWPQRPGPRTRARVGSLPQRFAGRRHPTDRHHADVAQLGRDRLRGDGRSA